MGFWEAAHRRWGSQRRQALASDSRSLLHMAKDRPGVAETIGPNASRDSVPGRRAGPRRWTTEGDAEVAVFRIAQAVVQVRSIGSARGGIQVSDPTQGVGGSTEGSRFYEPFDIAAAGPLTEGHSGASREA